MVPRGGDWDWVDHITPIAKGGRPELDNGRCSSSNANFAKRDGPEPPVVLCAGAPGKDWHQLHEAVQRSAEINLLRLSNLHVSDWYFNRALARVLFGVDELYNLEIGKRPKVRGAPYYSNAAFRALAAWRRHAVGVPTLEARGLVPTRPTDDQTILLGLRNASSTNDVTRAMGELLPFTRASMRLFAQIYSHIEDGEWSAAVKEALKKTWPPGVAAKLARWLADHADAR